VRALAVTVLFALKCPEKVLKVSTAYPDDGLPEVAYGRVLALFQLGRDHDATTARWGARIRPTCTGSTTVADSGKRRQGPWPGSLRPDARQESAGVSSEDWGDGV
jgi:hypothetical protein